MTDETQATTDLSPTDRKLAEIRAHKHYEAVKAKNPYREPSELELREHAEAEAFAKQPRAIKLAAMVDALLLEARNQVKHNAPVSPSIVQQLEAIRALLS